jgi:MOSC domain-containing protein YiiM
MSQHDTESTRQVAAVVTESDGRARTEDDQREPRDRVTGKLERIWLKRAKGGPMDAVNGALLEVNGGLRGNANRGGKRQVTIISRERWAELMDALAADLSPSVRRANLMVSGLNLENSRGRILRIGATRLQINGETRPCEQMEAAHAGLQELMKARWGGGAFAEVVDGGEIGVGDEVEWIESLITDH